MVDSLAVRSLVERNDEHFGLSVGVDGGGVKVRAAPISADLGPGGAGEWCPELLISGVVDRKRARLGVGAGRSDDVSDSRSLALP